MLLSGLVAGTSTPATAADAVAPTSSVVTSTVNDMVVGSTSGFAYSSGWRTSAGVATKYLGDDHYSYTAGSSYSFRFTGTSVQLFGAKAAHHGQASVQIDGGPAVTVDSYASSRQDNTLLFTSPTLAAGAHTVKVTVKGTRNTAATGTVVAIDRAVSSAPAPTSSVVASTVNDMVVGSTSGFAYSSGWRTSAGVATKYLGDDHYSYTAGSSYSFRFTGTSVQLFGAKAAHHGQASVQIDGGPAVTVDSYASSRQDNTLLFTSPTLAAGAHTVKVTVKGTRNTAATGTVVAIDRAVSTAPTTSPAPTSTTSPTPTSTTSPAPAPTTSTAPAPTTSTAPAPTTSTAPAPTTGRVVLAETGDGPNASPYASTTLNSTHPLWYVEGGSASVNRANGSITKVDSKQYHRVFSKKRLGGPGKTLRISYRARATSMYNRSGSSVIEGAKIGLKFPVSSTLTGYSKEDPRSVIGAPSSDASPGSYQLLTGITENGYMEMARNPYGTGSYKFWPNKRIGYTVGTWKDIVVTVEWVNSTTMRVKYWHNATGTGAPVYEATDTNSPFASEPGFLWLRSDDTNFAYDFLTVEEI